MREVLGHVRARGLRTVYEPAWRAPAPPVPAGAGAGRAAALGRTRRRLPESGCSWSPGTIPGTLAGIEGLAELVETLARCPATRVTLACADGFGADRYGGYYQRQGVEVAAGPLDWLDWCGDRRYHYSHVVVSDEGLTTRLWPVVRSSQPQALAVLYSERLPFRRNQALGDASWHIEGTETVAEVLQARLLRQLEGIEMAWCASERGRQPGGRPLARTGQRGPARPGRGPGGAPRGSPTGTGWRWWPPTASMPPADPEDPVMRALEGLVPAWRRRDMSLQVRVISDWPTPGLAHMAAKAGAEIVPSGGDLVAALSTARLVVAPVHHGMSASGWVAAAAAAGTPWLCTPEGVAGTDLGRLQGPLSSPTWP